MTKAEIRAYVLDRLGVAAAESGRVAQINAQIDREYRRLVASERLMDATAALAFVAGDPLVTLPADLLEIVTIRDGSREAPWRTVTRREFSEAANGGTDVLLGVYRMEGTTKIRLPFTPAAAVASAATIEYVPQPAVLADGDEPVALPSMFHDLLAESVVYRLAMSEEDQGLAQGAFATAAGLRAELRAHMGRRGGGVPDTIQVRGLR